MKRDATYLALMILIVVATFFIPAPRNRVARFDAERQSTPPDTTPVIEATTTTTESATPTTEPPAPTAIPVDHTDPAPTPQIHIAAPAGGDACDGIDWVIPVKYVWRESHCIFDAVSPGGQYVGAYQFDVRHWIPADQGGWGGCADLGDWHEPAAQHECAYRLSDGGTVFTAWGG